MRKLEGIYLVIDPSMEEGKLLHKLESAIDGGIDILQIWSHWPKKATHEDKVKLIDKITAIAAAKNVPVLINEEWQLLKETNLDGVHFDLIPENWTEVRNTIPKEKIIGFTAGNNLERIRWANENEIDYLSFCAMFPSSSAISCEIVKPSTVLLARQITSLPLFLSGGINPENLQSLGLLDFQGVAIISGIMSADNPAKKVKEYKTALAEIKK
ncbi:thiamine phosphate synthase [Owenweeksia hongkongensis]|uniref:thiamine phosphate synthase n=1 Tax=Owenweeksia hongkongensis TaxID=253245 RepID=UPI003A8DA055